MRLPGRSRPHGRKEAVRAALAAAFLLSVASCSSDIENLVGTEFIDAGIDSTLQTVALRAVNSFGVLNVEDEELPYSQNQVLYLGRQGTESSSIIARYDFAAFADTFTAAAVVESNIKSVRLFLYMLDFYADFLEADGTTLAKIYRVQELSAPLDSTAYPGPLPDVLPGILNFEGQQEPLPAASPLIIPLDPARLLAWYEAREHNGILIGEADDPDSDPGFVGFAAFGFKYAGSTLAPELEGTIVGPILNIEFEEPEQTFARLAPMLDLSTLDAVDPVPLDAAAGMVVRTHLRSYPSLSFPLGSLPERALINRAVIGVVNDTLQSYGPLETIVVAEIPASLAPEAANEIALDDLEQAVFAITARQNLDPRAETLIEFDVTSSVQRFINNIFTEDMRFLLSAPEDVFTAYDFSTIDPDFYLRRFRFYGTGAPDSLRPYLRITYTTVEGLSSGGD